MDTSSLTSRVVIRDYRRDTIYDVIIDALKLLSQSLILLSSYDYANKFYEVSLKAMFLTTFYTLLGENNRRCTIRSETSPDNKAGSYADLIIEDILVGAVYLLEFKYTAFTYIKDFRKTYIGPGSQEILSSTENTTKPGWVVRQESDSALAQWNETWRAEPGLKVMADKPGEIPSPLAIYGKYDFAKKKDVTFHQVIFVDTPTTVTDDETQLLTYTMKAMKLNESENPQETKTIKPILVRGILNRLFYTTFDYSPEKGLTNKMVHYNKV